MKHEKLFQLALCASDKKAYGDLSKEETMVAFNKAIQSYIHSPVNENNGRKIQAFTGSPDIDTLTAQVFNVNNTVANYDILWQEAFRSIPLGKGELYWEIADVDSAAKFKKLPEGEKVEIFKYSGDKVLADVELYGMGLGFTWKVKEGKKMSQFIDSVEQTRAKLFSLWGNVHYGLLATAGASNQVAWQGVSTDSLLTRDILTLNKGAGDLGNANKDKGYGDVANAPMVMYASPLLKSRLNRALIASGGDTGMNQGQVLDYPIEVRYTYNSNVPANKALIVLPGRKIQNAVYMRSMEFNEIDKESLNDIFTYFTAFGAIVADTDQVFELAFS